METIAIIGGGAAGLAAAGAAASEFVAAGDSGKNGAVGAWGADGMRAVGDSSGTGGAGDAVGSGAVGANAALAGVEIVVFEADERVGRSILATGNGRCNFSNARIDAARYRNSAFVAEAFGALGALSDDPVHAFFANLGLVWREEGEGRLYPLANKASSVLDVLRAALARLGVRVECNRRATRIDPPKCPGERYHIRFEDGSVAHAREVVVAAGGRTARELLPGNLPFVERRCVLGPLRTDDQIVKSLNNVRVRCTVALLSPNGSRKAAESGEVLFRDYGVSGIAVFNLSRFAEPGDVLRIDLLPHLDFSACEEALRSRLHRFGKEWFSGMLLPSVARAACKQAGLRMDEALGDGGGEGHERDVDAAALARALKEFPLRVRGVGDAKQCQVTRGGFDVRAFDPATMQALELPGVHVAGEALDVDAPCGGYNLHWAWASGILAGIDSARRLMADRGFGGGFGDESGDGDGSDRSSSGGIEGNSADDFGCKGGMPR